MNNKIISFNILIVILLLALSCNKSKKSEDIISKSSNVDIKEIRFPDSTYFGKEVKGFLKYNLSLDTLDLLDVDERFIFFYLTTDKNVESLEDIKKIKHEIFIDTIGNGVIDFKIRFDNTGNSILSGVIEDKIIFKTPNEKGEIRIVSKETSVSKKVFVRDNITPVTQSL